ncbi:molybdopterin-dependent oxidoreductase [Roseomonas sp. SSH11]|uniref:Molybdopterin-dependent oxidoreductase n=1 Tax=Pararoseomonas baculiformis TaxID=2820812 RepID=A0ABS4AM76_9PROT|nr:nitrate reductase [Pararoseomonas baculiformis]MBP0447640.1 molybdopterin-dependent oxidoreductase [Pararoseomonas baculiformis]
MDALPPSSPGAVRTTCPYCGVGCGVLAAPDGRIAGDPDHPANRGRLCSKGTALGETLNLPGRLLHPEVMGKRASWDAALDTVAEGFRRAQAELGRDGLALYVSGQLLTEDYYVANKLAKGFLGTANIDSNSRLCMASAVAAHRRAFGEDVVTGVYEDLETADLVVLVGSNLAWCHPVLFQRIMAARALRPTMRLVIIDPRRTPSAESADLHLPIRPGSDVALYNALLAHLDERGLADNAYVEAHTEGLDAALAAARADAADAAGRTGLDPADLATFLRWFAETPRVVTLWSQGINQSETGTDGANAIINAHLLTGRIGRPGMGPLSITGQPNAMGGREVGALANMLAGHLDWSVAGEADLVRQHWNAPNLATGPGLKAVDLFRALGRGRIGALWIMATNPAVSLPEAGLVHEALSRAPFLVVSEVMRETDTAAYAHVRLPALGWAEKKGTVTNSERMISRQRSLLPPPGEARADWWIISQVAARLGWGSDFAWTGPAAIFREHAALTGRGNNGTRAFDISGLAGLTDEDYDALAPTRWPVPASASAKSRLFADGAFPMPSGRAKFVAVSHRQRPEGAGLLTLLTGRLRDQWHTMTRTGGVPRLMAHAPEPVLTVHPEDAGGLTDGSLVRVTGHAGAEAVLRLRYDPGQRRGSVFAPMHWTAQAAPRARINPAVPAATDPVSAQPALKSARVKLSAYDAAWHGFLIARRRLEPDVADWVAVSLAGDGVYRHELAGAEIPQEAFARLIVLLGHEEGEWARLEDPKAGLHRAVLLRDGRVDAALFIGPDHDLPSRDWLSATLGAGNVAPTVALLAGSPASGPAPSPTLCVCHGVAEGAVRHAIAGGACSVAMVGEATQAGTGCGSCRPEITALLARVAVELA